MPTLGGGIIPRAIGSLARLSGWQRSAAAGSMLLLGIGGIGIVLLLGFGLVRWELTYVAQAGALFVLLVVSGAVGGIAYHLTAPLRGRGTIAYHTSAILTVYGYFLAVFAMLGLVAPEVRAILLDPAAWLVFGVVGIVFGVVFGRVIRG